MNSSYGTIPKVRTILLHSVHWVFSAMKMRSQKLKLLRIKITWEIWLELDPISSIIILNEKLIFSSLGFWNKLQNWSELTVALRSKLPLSGQLCLISKHRNHVRDTTVVLLEGLKKVWVWISGPCFAILYKLYIHLHVHVWHWNPTLEQQSASFQQHNMPDQMSWATKSPAKRKSPVTFAVMGYALSRLCN